LASNSRFRRIVVGFDGSKDSAKAVRLACSIAARNEARVTVVHVYTSPVIAYSAAAGMPIPDYGGLEQAAKGKGKEVLARGVQLASDAGIRAGGELLEASSVVEAMVEYAAKEKADLIVVGTRGMTGFKKLIMGSVSSGLVSHSPCSVLVAR
jgi:nucleotide-binding universal stress UspA family protein